MARREATSLTELGHLLETFVVGELLKQASWLETPATFGHWRTYDGDEVDLVVERDDGAIAAFEVKAGARVPGTDLVPLRKLRDRLGDAFIAGVVLYLHPNIGRRRVVATNESSDLVVLIDLELLAPTWPPTQTSIGRRRPRPWR